MIKQIIKSDGRKVPFNKSRIDRAISRAAKDAGLESGEINKLVSQISDMVMDFLEPKDKATTKEVREKILSELDKIAPAVSSEWRKYAEKNQ